MHRSNRPECARRLRKEPPAPERLLWQRLRNRELAGWKFRRQVPLGRYVVDFACVDAAVVVELDGKTHVGNEAYDRARTRELEQLGWRVIHFVNGDVTGNLDGVLEAILAQLGAAPTNRHPGPLPLAGEGEAALSRLREREEATRAGRAGRVRDLTERSRR